MGGSPSYGHGERLWETWTKLWFKFINNMKKMAAAEGQFLPEGESMRGTLVPIPESQGISRVTREKDKLLRLAWRGCNRILWGRRKRVAALDQAIRQGSYHIDPGKLSGALLHPDDLQLTSLMARYPVLNSEHVALYGRNAARDLLVTLETRDRFTGQHCARVSAIALSFARHLGLPPNDVELLKTASYLHDIGKVEISKSILLKKGRLTSAERSTIETHPAEGVRITGPLDLVPEEQEIILHHHEQWDGLGYPLGLVGDQIPLTIPQALEVILDRAGSQFDPHLAGEFLQIMAKVKKL
jgi:putative nucleotidyltransferase with HDIG domain